MDEEAPEAPEPPDPWQAQREALGSFIRSQRRLANMSLRDLADVTKVSNPYLSQVERGLHAPSVRVLQSIARALNLSADMVMTQAGWFDAAERSNEGSDAGGGSTAGEATAGQEPARPGGDAPAPQPTPGTEAAIRMDPRLSEQQKQSLLAVYRTYVGPGSAP